MNILKFIVFSFICLIAVILSVLSFSYIKSHYFPFDGKANSYNVDIITERGGSELCVYANVNIIPESYNPNDIAATCMAVAKYFSNKSNYEIINIYLTDDPIEKVEYMIPVIGKCRYADRERLGPKMEQLSTWSRFEVAMRLETPVKKEFNKKLHKWTKINVDKPHNDYNKNVDSMQEVKFVLKSKDFAYDYIHAMQNFFIELKYYYTKRGFARIYPDIKVISKSEFKKEMEKYETKISSLITDDEQARFKEFLKELWYKWEKYEINIVPSFFEYREALAESMGLPKDSVYSNPDMEYVDPIFLWNIEPLAPQNELSFFFRPGEYGDREGNSNS